MKRVQLNCRIDDTTIWSNSCSNCLLSAETISHCAVICSESSLQAVRWAYRKFHITPGQPEGWTPNGGIPFRSFERVGLRLAWGVGRINVGGVEDSFK